MTLLTSSWLALLFFTLLATTWAADTSLIPTAPSSSFPACGLSCSILISAQDSCTAATDQSTWVSCFCQSALLTSLKTSGSVCPNCDASDQALVSTWYNNYCNSGGADTGASAPATTTTATAPTTTGASSAASSDPASTTEPHADWWSTHYQWVIMLIVLAVGFGALAALGVWLKRRYDAKRPGLYHGGSETVISSSGRGMLSPTPTAPWVASPVPNQSVASSSRADVAPKDIPVMGNPSKLYKPPQSAGDVEIRHVSRR